MQYKNKRYENNALRTQLSYQLISCVNLTLTCLQEEKNIISVYRLIFRTFM